MDITLKNVKIYAGLSEETIAFNASVSNHSTLPGSDCAVSHMTVTDDVVGHCRYGPLTMTLTGG